MLVVLSIVLLLYAPMLLLVDELELVLSFEFAMPVP